MQKMIRTYHKELTQELKNILNYWMKYVPDKVHGGFYGKVNNDNVPDTQAPKGSVMYSRILWTFSAAYNLTGLEKYLQHAFNAAARLGVSFIDPVHGGVYWTIDANNKPLDSKKQVYAQAFAIYALSEFCLVTGQADVREEAIKLYKLVVEHSYDAVRGGYIEALAPDWKPTNNLRLSARDANEKKSMNTHLHVLEGFANLYRIWPDKYLKKRIEELILLFLEHITDRKTGHLVLFFNDDWKVRSHIHSYGHDIEAAWLIQEAAQAIKNKSLEKRVITISLKIAQAALEGMDQDGGLWYEYDAGSGHLVKEKHWWPQAEAMVGFYNMYQNTGDEIYLQHSLQSWEFVKAHLLDKENGEWFWGIKEDGSVMQEDKAGLWKCPYHNGRACMELIRRLSKT